MQRFGIFPLNWCFGIFGCLRRIWWPHAQTVCVCQRGVHILRLRPLVSEFGWIVQKKSIKIMIREHECEAWNTVSQYVEGTLMLNNVGVDHLARRLI